MSSSRSKRRRIQNEVNKNISTIRSSTCHISLSPGKTEPGNESRTCILEISVDICSSISYKAEVDIDNDSSSVNSEERQSLRESLAFWSTSHNISHSALNDLLKVLSHFTSESLPKDSRTLLSTRVNIVVSQMGTGQFYYFGIKDSLIKRIQCGLKSSDYDFPITKNHQDYFDHKLITISVGIDGLPIFKSTNSQFWPILGRVDQSICEDVFVIALYAGQEKPPLSEFLNEFIQEEKQLENTGVLVNSTGYCIRISCIIADAPARSYVKASKNHNAYFACDKCEEEGDWEGRVMLLGLDSNLRTDMDFRIKKNPQHHVGTTPLLELSFGVVTQMPLDYMHLICLGVMRKLLHTWLSGPLSTKLPSRIVNQINSKLESFKCYIPSEFARKTRSLKDLSCFKATEFRLFLLYVGPAVLRTHLPNAQYDHFLLLSSATHILISDKASNPEWNSLAEKMLRKFVELAKVIYGDTFIIYNVHSLIHIAKDALQFGALDNFSAFPYENYMQQLKYMLRSKHNHLQQVVRRIYERELWITESSKMFNSAKNTSHLYGRISKFTYNGSYITTTNGNNCFILVDDRIVIVTGILINNSEVKIYCKPFLHKLDLKSFPIDSTDIGICRVRETSRNEILVDISSVLRKCVLLPSSDKETEYFCYPFGKYLNKG